MASDFTWPKPWLLGLYDRAVSEGCVRIKMRGETEAEREREWKSFRASFLRLRRKKDANFAVQMRLEYQLVSLRYEPELGKALIIFDALPDGNTLPEIESVEGKRELPKRVEHTPEADPEEFDATEHVKGLIEGLDLSDDEESASEL